MTAETPTFTRAEAEHFVRMLNLYFNRTIAYAPDHPVAQETVPKVAEALAPLMQSGSISLILQEFGYYIGHVDVVYQPNNKRVADHLKRFGVESISLSPPLTLQDLSSFLEACSLTHANPESFARFLITRGAQGIAVNNVSLQTVREGEQVTSGGTSGDPAAAGTGTMRNMAAQAGAAGAQPGDPSFDDVAMRVVLGHLTAKEFAANLDILRLLEEPGSLPKTMTEVSSRARPEDQAHALRQSLENVLGAFSAQARSESAPVEDLLAGMYAMRTELLKAVKAQQGLTRQLQESGEVTRATDDIFVRTSADLVMAEFERSKHNLKKTAQVIQRIVPERQHLQQVLSVLRQEFLKRGFPLIEYYNLLSELNLSIGSNDSYHDFLKAGESVGLQADELLKEIQENPKQAAQLIVLASEMRKIGKGGSADELIRQLTDYVEKAGEAFGDRAEAAPQDAMRMAQMLHQLENEMNAELSAKEVSEETRNVGRQKLRLRLQQSVGNIKTKAALTQLRNTALTETEKAHFLLELFSDEKELDSAMEVLQGDAVQDAMLKDISTRVVQKVKQELSAKRERSLSKELPQGIYVKAVLDFFLKFEVSRAARYNQPFSAILVSFQGLPEDPAQVEKQGDTLRGLQNVLIGDLRRSMRDADFIGYLSFNRFIVVLPMTPIQATQNIIRKYRESLTRQLALPDGSRIWVRPRCGIAGYDKDKTGTYAKIFAELTRTWQADG
jgi:hypothetical protein